MHATIYIYNNLCFVPIFHPVILFLIFYYFSCLPLLPTQSPLSPSLALSCAINACMHHEIGQSVTRYLLWYSSRRLLVPVRLLLLLLLECYISCYGNPVALLLACLVQLSVVVRQLPAGIALEVLASV